MGPGIQVIKKSPGKPWNMACLDIYGGRKMAGICFNSGAPKMPWLNFYI